MSSASSSRLLVASGAAVSASFTQQELDSLSIALQQLRLDTLRAHTAHAHTTQPLSGSVPVVGSRRASKLWLREENRAAVRKAAAAEEAARQHIVRPGFEADDNETRQVSAKLKCTSNVCS
jgi:hypothetical protein